MLFEDELARKTQISQFFLSRNAKQNVPTCAYKNARIHLVLFLYKIWHRHFISIEFIYERV